MAPADLDGLWSRVSKNDARVNGPSSWVSKATPVFTVHRPWTQVVFTGLKLITFRVQIRQFAATAPTFNLPHLHLAPPLGVTLFEFCRDFRQQKTRVPALSCGVVRVILRLAVWRIPEYRLVTDGQADTRWQRIPALASVARVQTYKGQTICRRLLRMTLQVRQKYGSKRNSKVLSKPQRRLDRGIYLWWISGVHFKHKILFCNEINEALMNNTHTGVGVKAATPRTVDLHSHLFTSFIRYSKALLTSQSCCMICTIPLSNCVAFAKITRHKWRHLRFIAFCITYLFRTRFLKWVILQTISL